MNMFTLLPLFLGMGYIAMLIGLFFLIYTWVNKFIILRQEQNDLLREIIKKMDNK
jgi:hypothetical protein